MTAFCVVVSLLFSQLAMATYACPALVDPEEMAAMPAGMPCDQMDTDPSVLCHRHAADAAQASEVVKVPTPSLPAVIHVLVVAVVRDTAPRIADPRLTADEARPPPDPLFLSTRRLRV